MKIIDQDKKISDTNTVEVFGIQYEWSDIGLLNYQPGLDRLANFDREIELLDINLDIEYMPWYRRLWNWLRQASTNE